MQTVSEHLFRVSAASAAVIRRTFAVAAEAIAGGGVAAAGSVTAATASSFVVGQVAQSARSVGGFAAFAVRTTVGRDAARGTALGSERARNRCRAFDRVCRDAPDLSPEQ